MSRPLGTKGRSCTGKVRHLTRAAAEDHLWRLIRRGAVRLAVYRCDHCAGFHVGHLPKPRRTR